MNMFKAWIYPVVNDMYIDVVSLRTSVPNFIDGKID